MPRGRALAFMGSSLAYKHVYEASVQTALDLLNADVRPGDRVGVYLEKSPEEVYSLFGTSKAGGVFVILNPALTPEQVEYVAGQSGFRCLITDPVKVRAVMPRLKKIKTLACVMTWSGGRLCTSWVRSGSRKKALRRNRSDLARLPLSGGDLAAILYTSGSTGAPKGVMLTHQNICLSAHSSAEYLGNQTGDVLMGVLPLSFDYGLAQLNTAFKMAGTLVLKKFISGEDLMRTVWREKANGLAGIPTLLIPAVESEAIRSLKFPHLRYLSNSGGRLPVKYFRSLQKLLPHADIYSMYGFTEAFRASYLEPSQLARRPDSIGKAIPNARLYVLDERGRECPAGKPGELVQGGPLVSKGYWNNPEETARKIRQNPLHQNYDDPVCFSGDTVVKDKEGFLYFLGRKDQLLKCSGFRLNPDEIEAVLGRHPDIRHAAVAGIPDDLLGHRILAAVTLRKGSRMEQRLIQEYCRRHLPAYMCPQEIRILKKMPLTANGKIDRKALLRARA